MKSWLALKNKPVIILLSVFTTIALFLHLYKINMGCLNADEAAFGYNAYSILKTGRDEYGNLLPLRLKSFGDYKLPLLAYLTVPFVGLLGLNEFSTRTVPVIIGIITPLLFYFLAKEITGDRRTGLIAAFLGSVSPWVQIITRHAHEASLAYLFISLAVFCLLRYRKTTAKPYLLLYSACSLLALFSYHSSRLLIIFLSGYLVVEQFLISRSLKRLWWPIVFAVIPLVIFFFSETIQPNTRVNNLLFYKTSGFSIAIEQFRKEDNNQFLRNKFTQAMQVLSKQYLSYFSPEFLAFQGDQNKRFGYPGMSPITPIEYIFLFIGLYYVFKKQLPKRLLLTGILLIAPLTAALTWQENSLTRSYFLIVPIIIIVSYGVAQFWQDVKGQLWKTMALIVLILMFVIFSLLTWDFYFNHYYKRPEVGFAWQCGYKELTQYVKNDYAKYNQFYITEKNGQPYIFFLYYLQYPPAHYQAQARLSPPDVYGFGQVAKFDKFIFSLPSPYTKPKTVYVGYFDDFNADSQIDLTKIKKIAVNNTDIFWIYESDKEK
ncbi:hypothetical protein A2966_02175 [Candidatus Roizmanbacteria bacterium RIFCSPLOWO2_01_FULL_41_22]|uniref:Glycosyltransferase RgtA/B/C/D-like domain-containing protein n=1 Tax=Candidatus Roizmanbacteria bacterium RIFCSPLOWO2_01_FULL_41_22 TaxID=1802067 RepID=A0A1F7JAJ2_9BACT|nr:MAG: hypothetical protein A2966_02175 [Candidatus Roizmanbacteria bacterium RIFCSPLOWO2_01_FULL_41_22]